MTEQELESQRYPIGRAKLVDLLSEEQRSSFIQVISDHPQQLRATVEPLSDIQLDTPYRVGGWTIRQLVHHIADSHLNSYVRFKWTLTEEEPLIKTYDQVAWAELPDSLELPISHSLNLLDAVHFRWVYLLRAMKDEDFQKKLEHPEWGLISLDKMVCLYEWHCRHHLAHIQRAIS